MAFYLKPGDCLVLTQVKAEYGRRCCRLKTSAAVSTDWRHVGIQRITRYSRKIWRVSEHINPAR